MRYLSVGIVSLLCISAVLASSWDQVEVLSDGTKVDREYLENNYFMRQISDNRRIAQRPKDLQVNGSAVQRFVFDNLIDHFNPLDTRTYKQRVSVIDQFYEPGNPVFIFLDGEANMDFFDFQEVSGVHWAAQFGALYISIEHRYYGESLPFDRFTTQNMTYLSSQQALADAAYFINSYNATIDNPGPWVVFGCSYSGALSAWFRLKYPQLVVASVAPSGPVYALTNFTGYYGQFETSCELEGFYDCIDYTKAGVYEVSELLKNSSGIDQLQQIFNTCTPIVQDQIWFFKYVLMSQVGGSDQMDNPPDWPLNATCQIMTSTPDPIANWAATFPEGACVSINETAWLELMNLEIPNSNRAWFWQKCTEFGFLKPSYPGTSIFWDDIPVDPMIAWCEQIFEVPDMAPNTEWTNTYYGGYDLAASEVLFTNGLLDPWHLLSIYADTGDVQAVTYQAGHCGPMDAPNPTDPPSLTEAREEVTDFLSSVLNMQPNTRPF